MWHAYAQYTYIWLLHYKFICWDAYMVLHVGQVPMLVIDNWGMCFDYQTFWVFRNSWIDYRDTFHAIIYL